jgi:SHS2 domain-containing protein
VSYHWVEHTGEVELEIEGPTAEAVFTEALRALAELIDDGCRGDSVVREIALVGRERSVLLVQWLDELVYRAETEDLVPEDAVRIELDQHGLAAAVRCHRGHPRHLVKAATYHRLVFEASKRGFRATVVLDV